MILILSLSWWITAQSSMCQGLSSRCWQAARLQDVGELGVPEGHVWRPAGQCMDAVPQRSQAPVDELGLLQPPVRVRALVNGALVQALAAGQVHQPQLGPPHVP